MTDLIPDPLEPEKRAIDGKTGEMLGPVYWLPAKPGETPTVAQLMAGTVIGWSRGPSTNDDEARP